MFRNLKALGLLMSAALAISATFAAGAQGQTHEETTLFGTLTSGTIFNEETENYVHEKVHVYGEQIGEVNYFEVFGQKFACPALTGEGTVDGTETEGTLEPTIEGCTATGGLPATVHTNGCRYVITHPQTIEPAGTYTGKVALTCPHEASIDIEVFGSGNHTEHSGGVICTVRVHATGSPTESEGETKHVVQELGGHMIYRNGVSPETGRHDITAEATIEGISATRQGLCTLGTHQTTNAGVLVGTVTLTATEDEGGNTTDPRDLWISESVE